MAGGAREGLVELVAVVRPCPVHANVCVLVRGDAFVLTVGGGDLLCRATTRHTQPEDEESHAKLSDAVWKQQRRLVSFWPSLRDLGVLISLQDMHTE